jgi:hypothetical protein
MNMPRFFIRMVWFSLAAFFPLLPGCDPEGETRDTPSPSSRSYQGHEDDTDINNLVAAYPSLVGTRLDDCQTCHTGTIEDGRLVRSSCDRCHDLLLPATGRGALETLNGFGLDYLEGGRSPGALESIRGDDSDGDGFSNHEELLAGRYPGSERSQPGQAVARLLVTDMEELQALPSHTQFLLVNTTQQPFDDYATYRGVRVKDLLDALNIDRTGATGITVIAPDGYLKSLPMDFVDEPFPQALYYGGMAEETLGPGCGVVQYPGTLPGGVSDGAPIPGELWLLLAYERDGGALDPASLDVADGRIVGQGPLRMVVPQANPGPPDRGSRVSPSGCGDDFDFREEADHNAGAMVRGVVAIRIDPMPAGVEEFDYMNGGWAYVDSGQLIVYGHGVGR